MDINANESSRKSAGVVGFFDGPDSLMSAAEKARDARFESFDTFTPYPVHGMEDAQGLKRSPLPYITFTFGLTGTACAFLLQYLTSAVDWPIIVGGKPFNSWPAFVPVMFELTILFAGLSTVFGMFALNRLPNTSKKIVDSGITRDKFAMIIEPPTEENRAMDFLRSVGATEVRSVNQEGWF